MVSVTMSAELPPPPYKPETGIVIFQTGSGAPSMHKQIDAYYEANFRAQQMENFARFVLEKGHGATTPHGRRNSGGVTVSETWQACGRRLFGDRFIAVMERAVAEYRDTHASAAPAAREALPEPPAHVLEEIPEPEF